jgi:predicted phage gp36 major capsid-like protein
MSRGLKQNFPILDQLPLAPHTGSSEVPVRQVRQVRQRSRALMQGMDPRHMTNRWNPRRSERITEEATASQPKLSLNHNLSYL